MRYLLLILYLLPAVTNAAAIKYVDLQSRVTKLHQEINVNDDFTVVTTTEIQVKALTDDAAKRLKQRKLSYSTSIEKLQVLDAYTLKADGRKLQVPKSNYQETVNKGKANAGALFSDRTYLTVVFPDVEKNDSVYLRTRRIETVPMFPGEFSDSSYFYSQTAYDDVRVRFDLPEKLVFKFDARKMKQKSYVKDGRRIIELSYQNKKPIKSNREDFSVWDPSTEAGYAISTFRDYAAIGRAYAARAEPKAVPTARVKALARKIVGSVKDKKKQARLLYNWVATNISYAGNCIGVGAVVPHDTDLILDNRMGDCKDHATLLQALYSAEGIKSIQALINAGSEYHLSKVPLVMSVNHVINYLPKWNLFVDSTNSSMPFGQIGFSIMDKPVILVKGYIPNKKTPSQKPGEDRVELVSHMQIHADGSVAGDVRISLQGLPAIEARQGWRHVTSEQQKEWLDKIFSSDGKPGIATMTKDDPKPLLSKFKYAIKFKRPDFVLAKGTGGFYVGPLVRAPRGLYRYLEYPKQKISGYDEACGNGSAREQLYYTFPKNMKILAKPDDYEINKNHIHYIARYKLKGDKLTVLREIKDTSPANVCSPDLMNKQRDTLIKIVDSLKSQVIYQH